MNRLSRFLESGIAKAYAAAQKGRPSDYARIETHFLDTSTTGALATAWHEFHAELSYSRDIEATEHSMMGHDI